MGLSVVLSALADSGPTANSADFLRRLAGGESTSALDASVATKSPEQIEEMKKMQDKMDKAQAEMKANMEKAQAEMKANMDKAQAETSNTASTALTATQNAVPEGVSAAAPACRRR